MKVGRIAHDDYAPAAEYRRSGRGAGDVAAGIAVPSAPAAPEKNKLDKAFEKNFGSAEAMQKLGNKVVKTTLNPTTWKNGIYFWSVAGTAVLFLPILFYVLTKG